MSCAQAVAGGSADPRATSIEEDFIAVMYERSKEELPAEISNDAKQNLLNVFATAIGASQHASVHALIQQLAATGSRGTVPILGRSELLDPAAAALVTGFAAHLDDFDDTDLQTVIHPSAAPMAALMSAAWLWGATGTDLLRAFAVGCEVQLRFGRAISPYHYSDGWHITGTCGVVGAAAAVSVLARLPLDGFRRAISLASCSTLGLREGFGSSLKPLNAGKAAGNGLMAALQARRDLSCAPAVLSGSTSVFKVLSSGYDPKTLVADPAMWILSDNVIKPYPCGIVTHSCIDAGIALHGRVQDLSTITRIELRCNPLVVDLTGNLSPKTGLEARFSTVHGVAAGLVYGVVGLREYEDEIVLDPMIDDLRAKIELIPCERIDRDSALIDLVLADGSRLSATIDHARGSMARPLAEAELHEKALSLIEPVFAGRGRALIDAVGQLEKLNELAVLWDCVLPLEGR